MGTNDTVIAVTTESGLIDAVTSRFEDVTSNLTSSTLHTFHVNSTDLDLNDTVTKMAPAVVSGMGGLSTTVTVTVALSSVAFLIVIGKLFLTLFKIT